MPDLLPGESLVILPGRSVRGPVAFTQSMTSIVVSPIDPSDRVSNARHKPQRCSIRTNVSVPVLILADTSLVLHHGTLGIIRTLGRMGVPVYTVLKDRFTPAAGSKFLTGAFIWQPRGLNTQEFLEGMDLISKALPRPTVLVPTDDCSAILITEHAAVLEQQFLFPKQDRTLPRLLANKRTLYLLCKQMGVPYPRTCLPVSITDLDEFVASAQFPVVVKAAEPWLLPRGARSTTIARTPQQLFSLYRTVTSQHATTLIVQEYIGPEHGEDWFYHGYINTSTRVRIGFTGRKFRSYPPATGPTTLGRAVVNDTLRRQAELFLASLNYCGIMDLDYRFDRRDGQYKLVDFNPRIGAQFRLFEDEAGIDVVRALYIDLTGEPPRVSPPVAGRTFVADFHDFAARFCNHGNSARPDVESLQPLRTETTEFAWFCMDDLLPFLLMCTRLTLRVIGRVTRAKPLLSLKQRTPKQIKPFTYWLSLKSNNR